LLAQAQLPRGDLITAVLERELRRSWGRCGRLVTGAHSLVRQHTCMQAAFHACRQLLTQLAYAVQGMCRGRSKGVPNRPKHNTRRTSKHTINKPDTRAAPAEHSTESPETRAAHSSGFPTATKNSFKPSSIQGRSQGPTSPLPCLGHHHQQQTAGKEVRPLNSVPLCVCMGM
jgi:hypothetical protein